MNLRGGSLGTCRTFACTMVCGAQCRVWPNHIAGHCGQHSPFIWHDPMQLNLWHAERSQAAVSDLQHADGGSSPGQVPP